jgi:hypothetical protein
VGQPLLESIGSERRFCTEYSEAATLLSDNGLLTIIDGAWLSRLGQSVETRCYNSDPGIFPKGT